MIYLTDSIGSIIIDGQMYSITAGDAHIFNEGLEHYTIGTENSERLMIGPMSESGFRVGLIQSIIYFENETDAMNETNYIIVDYENYTIQTVNDISSWMIAKNLYGTNPTPNGGPYNTGDVLIADGIYYVYPYIAPAPTPPAPRRMYMGSLFTNNAQVYYKSNSLSTGSGDSGVKNSRHKQRRT